MASNSGGGKSPHLTLVKEGRSITSVEHGTSQVGVDALSTSQRKLIDALARIASPSGVLVGALVGRESSWDIRPLFLEQGNLTLVRRSAPTLSADAERLDALASVYVALESISGVKGWFSRYGIDAGTFWAKRPFYKEPFEEQLRNAQRKSVFNQILSLVEALHQKGTLHGHISPANLALKDGVVVFMDPGFSVFHFEGVKDAFHAPEIRRGEIPHSSADIFSIGMLLREMFESEIDDGKRAHLDRMLSDDPTHRPLVSQIAPLFQIQKRSGLAFAGPRSGKLLSGDIYVSSSVDEQPPLRPEEFRISVPPPKLPSEDSATIAPSSSAPLESKSSPLPQQWKRLLVLAGGIAIVIAVGFWILNTRQENSPLETYWASGQTSLMQSVAAQAVRDPHGLAATVVIDDALKGTPHTGVRNTLLRLAFHPLWKSTLLKEEEELALKIGLLELLKDKENEFSLPERLHPGIILAIASDLPENALDKELSRYSLSQVSTLPAPFGPAFRALGETGVMRMNELPARALAHLAAGDTSPRLPGLLFSSVPTLPNDPLAILEGRLRSFLKIAQEYPRLLEVLKTFIAQDGIPGLKPSLKWFEQDTTGAWKGIDPTSILAVVSGELPAHKLSFEQYADLTQFPSIEIRARALLKIAPLFTHDINPLIRFLAAGHHELSRGQVVVLLSALRFQGDKSYSFISGWMQLNPPPETVAQLVGECRACEGIDAFTIEAGRYLKGKSWSGDLPLYKKLVGHRDPFIRSLAYARLSVKIPEEAALLREAAEKEEKINLKSFLLQKLAGQTSEEIGDDTLIPIQ